MIKYRTGGWGKNLIEKIEVDRETEHSIWIKGHRFGKSSEYHKYFDTFYDAHAFLMSVSEKKIDNCRKALEVANGELGNIRGLKEDC